MIIKSFEIHNKLNKAIKENIFLIYGINEGLKDDIKKFIISKTKDKEATDIISLNEDEILKKREDFFNSVLIKSFFSNKKILIINNTSEKFFEIISELIKKKIQDVIIILLSGVLDKKSKIRNLCEKGKEIITIPCYEDTIIDLEKISKRKLDENKIRYSNEIINLLINIANGDRKNLYNEINKISSYAKTNKKITFEDIKILTNSNSDVKLDNLVNNCLSGDIFNIKKIMPELYLDNFNYILLLKIFSRKIERLIKLKKIESNFESIDQLITSLKPPIFWKEKPILKKQIKNWKINELEKIIFKLNKIEIECKTRSDISSIIFLNFFNEICFQASSSS